MIIFKFHLFYLVMAFICALTGYFKHFILFTLLIIIHELGHITGALIFKWKIKKVLILPLGGLTIFDEYLSKSIFEEFIILILGPLFQIIFYSIYTKIFGFNEIIYTYHYALLLFNMLPIFPLDGFKLLNIFFNKIFSYRKSFYLSIFISILTIISLIIYCLYFYYNINLLFMSIFLLFKLYISFKDLKYSYQKFLLERYLYNFPFKKRKVSKSIYDFSKECYHYIDFYEEKDYLNKYFQNKLGK